MPGYMTDIEPTYTYDDYRQDQLAYEAMELHDRHEREYAETGRCADPSCRHNRPHRTADDDVDADIPF